MASHSHWPGVLKKRANWKKVLRIRDILVRYRSGSKDPYRYLWLTDPYPRIRILLFSPVTFKTATKKIKFFLLLPTFLKGHFHRFSKIKSHKEVTKQYCRNQGFFLFFCWMIEEAGSGCVPLTNGSGSVRPENIRIRICNTGRNLSLLTQKLAYQYRGCLLRHEVLLSVDFFLNILMHWGHSLMTNRWFVSNRPFFFTFSL